jgi:hypothetical protein
MKRTYSLLLTTTLTALLLATTPAHAGYVDGMNLYQFVRSNPIIFTDPHGLATIVPGAKEPPWKQEAAWKKLDRDYNSTPLNTFPSFLQEDIARTYAYCATAERNTKIFRAVVPGNPMKLSIKAMKHYLGNTGTTMDVSGEMRQIFDDGTVNDSARVLRRAQVKNAALVIEEHLKKKGPMPEKFVSDEEVYVGGAADADLKGYTNAFSFWISVSLRRQAQDRDGRNWLSMQVTFHLRDVYDWDIKDTNKSALKTVTDADVGRLHYVGLARAYKVIGTHTRTYNWECGKGEEPHEVNPRERTKK